MSDFINKVKTKDGTEYEVHDARMPEIPAGGTKLYIHTLTKELVDSGGNGRETITLVTDKNDNIPTFVGKMLVISGYANFGGGGTPEGAVTGFIPLTYIEYFSIQYPHTIGVVEREQYQWNYVNFSGYTDTVTEL